MSTTIDVQGIINPSLARGLRKRADRELNAEQLARWNNIREQTRKETV